MKTMAALFMLAALGSGARHIGQNAGASASVAQPMPLVTVYATQGSPASEHTLQWLASHDIAFTRLEMSTRRSEVLPLLQELRVATTPVLVQRGEMLIAGFDRDSLRRHFSPEFALR